MTTITLPRATVEQALEALEYAQQDRECPSTTRQAIAALRAALAQQAEPTRSQQMVAAGFKPRDRRLECDECGGKFTAQMLPIHKCAQQAEPVQDQRCRAEPRSDGDFVCDCKIGECPGRSAEPAQEPVAWRWGYRSVTTGEMDWRGYVEIAAHPNLRSPEIIIEPLYTAPPQREPLPLKTVEKLIYENTKISPNVADDRELLGYIVNAVRAVERAHGIKE